MKIGMRLLKAGMVLGDGDAEWAYAVYLAKGMLRSRIWISGLFIVPNRTY